MRQPEREPLKIIDGAKRKQLTLAQAGELLSVCYRLRRIWNRCQEQDDAGPALYQEPTHADFGPRLLAEYLERGKIRVDHETVGGARPKRRPWRPRRACFAQTAQLDGFHHDWFERRRELSGRP